ncbi:MAG TPA: phage holin family protein [Terriglobales bacterium]|nr:phage holin family protein [Terriglobales bacterium]
MADHIYRDSKSLQQVLYDIKDELRDFISTRVDLLRAELIDKWDSLKAALPMVAAGVALLMAALLVFSFGLVALAAALIGGEFRWAMGALAVTVFYGLVGGVLAWMGRKQLSAEGLAPDRTLRVLKQDQLWIKNEARAS